jgi:hypothetical protein
MIRGTGYDEGLDNPESGQGSKREFRWDREHLALEITEGQPGD